jgi:hypothetical protein
VAGAAGSALGSYIRTSVSLALPLEKLDLTGCDVGKEGLVAIAGAMQPHTGGLARLTMLSVRAGSACPEEAAELVARAAGLMLKECRVEGSVVGGCGGDGEQASASDSTRRKRVKQLTVLGEFRMAGGGAAVAEELRVVDPAARFQGPRGEV